MTNCGSNLPGDWHINISMCLKCNSVTSDQKRYKHKYSVNELQTKHRWKYTSVIFNKSFMNFCGLLYVLLVLNVCALHTVNAQG